MNWLFQNYWRLSSPSTSSDIKNESHGKGSGNVSYECYYSTRWVIDLFLDRILVNNCSILEPNVVLSLSPNVLGPVQSNDSSTSGPFPITTVACVTVVTDLKRFILAAPSVSYMKWKWKSISNWNLDIQVNNGELSSYSTDYTVVMTNESG
jgi:hypothetical protein